MMNFLGAVMEDATYHRLYLTEEHTRPYADAKHFFLVSSGTSLVDSIVLWAIADSGNDILIGDYCEAANDETLFTLQKVGAARQMSWSSWGFAIGGSWLVTTRSAN